MPPHLHPRSRTTSSLFATTVLVSFVVVALPHVLPCPAPRSIAWADGSMTTEYVDGTGQRRVRRRRRKTVADDDNGSGGTASADDGQASPLPSPQRWKITEGTRGHVVHFDLGDDGERTARTIKRECPVPKPSGVLGRWLGFKPQEEHADMRPAKIVDVRIGDSINRKGS